MASAIPIKNVYYLLCYAWNRLKELELVDVATEGSTELVDLFARVMISGMHQLRRRGLEQGYTEHEEDIPGVRGRIRMFETVARFHDHHGRSSCTFDELTTDTPQNRVLKAAMRALCLVETLHKDHRAQLRRLTRDLSDVSECALGRSLFREVRLHANNRHYAFLMDLSALIYECVIPNESLGLYKFRDFSREGPEMARLFEDFVRNFLRLKRPDLAVGAEALSWVATSSDDPGLTLLPGMRTDITVRSSSRTLVIEAKFYEQTLQKHYDKKSVHSKHLYQLVAYLRSMEELGGKDAMADGMLLYPAVDTPLDVSYNIQGHRISIRTVDLAKDWQSVEADILALV